MKQRVRHTLQLAVVLALVLSMMPLQGVFAQDKMSDKADIVDTAIAAGDFTTLVELVQAAGLGATLRGEGPFTVFAPTDEAFAAVPAETLDALANDPAALESVLLYHVVPGRLIAALISDGKEVATAQGENAIFSFADGVKKIDNATIVGKDIQAGRLQPVLEEFEQDPLVINAVYIHRRHLSTKARTFVDFMCELFQPDPYWEKWIPED